MDRFAEDEMLDRYAADAITHIGPASRPQSDPIVTMLLYYLPPSGSLWPAEDRARWLALAAAAFDVVYQDNEKRPQPED